MQNLVVFPLLAGKKANTLLRSYGIYHGLNKREKIKCLVGSALDWDSEIWVQSVAVLQTSWMSLNKSHHLRYASVFYLPNGDIV